MRTQLTSSLCLCALLSVVGVAHALDGLSALDQLLPGDVAREAASIRPATELSPLRAGGLGAGWKVQLDPHTRYARMAYGGTVAMAPRIADAAQAEAAARGFVFAHEDLLGVRPDNSQVSRVRHGYGKWSVRFQQSIDGVPVWGGLAFVLLGENGHVSAFGSEFQPEPVGARGQAPLPKTSAIMMAAASIDATPRNDAPQTAALFWTQSAAGPLVLAWRTLFESDDPYGKWSTVVDATTGEILGRQNLYFGLDVTGRSEGSVCANPPTYSWCSGNSTYPFEDQTVTIVGGASAVTDENGNVTIPNAGVDPVEVELWMQGPYCVTHRMDWHSDAHWTTTVTPGEPFSLYWTTDHSQKDDRFAFYWVNRLHDFMKAIDPDLVEADLYPMQVFLAYQDGLGCPMGGWCTGPYTLHFCGGTVNGITYYNAAYNAGTVSHEYGHAVTIWVYGIDGPLSQGMQEQSASVLAYYITRLPESLGGSSEEGCTPDGVYDDAVGDPGWMPLTYFHWWKWQHLQEVLPVEEADRIAFANWHFGRLLGLPLTVHDEIAWAFLIDDDDANLGNGTPHYDQICEAALATGFECPELTQGVFISDAPVAGYFLDGSQGFDAVATVTSTEAPLDPSSLKAVYRVNGGAFQEIAMTPTGNPDEYTAHLPAMPSDAIVEYYLKAADVAGYTRTDPRFAPSFLHSFEVVYAYDDLESGAGWTAGLPGDNATAGQWVLGDPVGFPAAEPADDATPGAGVNCFMTGYCVGGGSCYNLCLNSHCNDVDGGTTTLLSPVYDLSGATSAQIRYSRSFYAAEPTDSWNVDVSNDAGATWVNIEHSNSDASVDWVSVGRDLGTLFGTLGQVQLRFRATDVGTTDTVVEGAVDDLRILARFGAVDAPVEMQPSVPKELSLSPVHPNPLQSATRVDFSVPQRSNVRLAVYDVGGREVRTLISGVRETGRYRADWDGRDSSGARVAAGVYFMRLTAAGDAVTRKVTVIQ